MTGLSLLLVATLGSVAATPVPAQAPLPVVERLLRIGDTTTRVSLFSNRVAVMSRRERGSQVMLRRHTLGKVEYDVYAAAVQRDAAAIVDQRAADLAAGPDAEGEIFLWGADGELRIVRYSPARVLDLPRARLVATLDDLQARIEAANPEEESLRGWRPKPGDRLELTSGAIARVVELRDSGVLVVAHEDTHLIEAFWFDDRFEVVRRLLAEPGS